MTDNTSMTRRGFLATNAAAATVATVPGVAQAALDGADAVAPRHWGAVTAEGMTDLIGQRFRVTSEQAGMLTLELVRVEPVQSGVDRPTDLPRSEGVIAVFDGPDKSLLVDGPDAVHRVSHPLMGAADLYLDRSITPIGDVLIEAVLN